MTISAMLALLLAFFIAIDSSEVYPPEVRETFVENSLAGETFTQGLPASTLAVFMTGNFGVCKSKKGIVIPLSEAITFAREFASKVGRPENAPQRLKMLDAIQDIARSALRMFHGELGIALLNLPSTEGTPDFILRADIDESEMTFMNLMKEIASALGVGPPGSFPREEEGYLNFAGRVYVRIRDGKLYMANSRLVIEQFLSGAWKASPLSESVLYRAAAKSVEFDQEQFLFVNVERIWDEFIAAHERMPGELKTVFAGLVGSIRAVATSTRLSKGNPNILSAVLFEDLSRGIPKIIGRPNAPSEAATFVPPDYSLLIRGNIGSPVALLRDVLELDEGLAREVRKALTRIERKLGVSVEQDMLPALSGDFALAAKMPPMVGLPQSLAIIRIADHDKASFVIESIVEKNRIPGFHEHYKGGNLHVLPLPLVSLTYILVESHLLVGSSPQVVRAAIDAHLSGKSLAASEEFGSAFDRHPSESMATIYAGAETIFDGLMNIGGSLAMWKRGQEAGEAIVPLIALLRRNARRLTPVSCSIYRDGSAIVIKTNSRFFAAGPIPIFLPALFLARRVEVEHQMIRQRQEAIRQQQKMIRKQEMADEAVL